MLPSQFPPGPLRIVALGAHCDDIVIAAGGTLHRLVVEHPGSSVQWIVGSGNEIRQAEEREAAAAFAAMATVDLHLLSFEENLFPTQFDLIKREIAKHVAKPADLVLAPRLSDRHQDHRIIAEIAHQTWRDHPIWMYEIAKWEGDLSTPNVYVRLSAEELARKVELATRCYRSQLDKTWFDDEVFRGLARLRGVECNERYAEGFHVLKQRF
jgi:LmbE family N-acetylglucosaminyl deacetylase